MTKQERRKEYDRLSTKRNNLHKEAATIAGFIQVLVNEECREHWRIEPGVIVKSDYNGPRVGYNKMGGAIRLEEEYKVTKVEGQYDVIEFGARPWVRGVKRKKNGEWGNREYCLYRHWTRTVDDVGGKDRNSQADR